MSADRTHSFRYRPFFRSVARD
ncbi:CRISPR-associated DxTHG motif protein [Mycolicibacterium fortuitum]|nr:CRISPR-associated DxTHG motif protein [Mycolicibacterium fortuitum]